MRLERCPILLWCLCLLPACEPKHSDAPAGTTHGKGAREVEHAEGRHGEDDAKHAEGDDHGVSELIELSDGALARAKIQTAKVDRRQVADTLRLPAEVRPHPDQIAHITPLVASQVAEVNVRPGDRVKKGQKLALLKSVQLGEARAQIAQARAALEVAKDQLNRQQQLMDAGIGAQKSYVEARGAVKQAEAALAAASARAQVYGGAGGSGATTVLRSPLDGTVVERHATAGEVASPEQELFVIANIDPVWVVGRAYESDLSKVRTGGAASVQVKAYPAQSWEGTVDYVSPTLQERTRTADVRIELDNSDGVLRPGMFATIVPIVAADEAGSEPVLAVPSGAVQRDGEQFVAFVAKGSNRFERRRLTLGIRGVDYVQVLRGLAAGESVVIDGAFVLKSEAAKHEMGGGHSH